jgi:hypothetical protein
MYDVNAERARRLEAAGGEHVPIKLDGTVYKLPREIPLELAERVEELKASSGADGIREILAIVLGEQAEEFPFSRLSAPDLAGVLNHYLAELGTSLGELQGSPTSSAPTATPSKRTSKPRTKSGSRTSTKAR